jgi:2-phosphoglycerate kinase
MTSHPPPWTVTLVCGASGVGKTSVAVPLAARYGAPLAEADDIVTALKAVTTPEQMPVLHFWTPALRHGPGHPSGSPTCTSRWST